ncbi:MAG TPA: bifunctional glutamate N-acetyltransferase/amino-acid acetyltransferase ArgJ [Jatrophihabitans sp.]|nr:bifunctional glutamate N-acetyltransferase/amino-acid acetyltransferase ArgJ [Jatrophihabitans sp.]
MSPDSTSPDRTSAGLWPRGFRVFTLDAGIGNDGRHDLAVAVSDVACTSAAMYTRSRFAGASVLLSRTVTQPQGVVVASRNANVATGEQGARDAAELADLAERGTGRGPLLVASTGVIGRPYPMPVIRSRLQADWPEPGDWADFATAIMTTDTHPKLVQASVGGARIVGVAKGVGMIEPNLATMLTFFATDAAVPAAELAQIFGRVVDVSFNALSIDTDTSTSDTAAIFANGVAGPVPLAEFEQTLRQLAIELVTQIARDGEGASKLITVTVSGGRDRDQARRVAKTIVNSPLVKTMVHGADPNWGRVVMAIGKNSDDLDIEPDRVRVQLCGRGVYPDVPGEELLAQLSQAMRGDSVDIGVDLGIGDGAFTVYGCDLTAGYVRINAEYTT